MQLGSPGDKISLTGSGEVHKLLGSQKLSRRLDCLPDFRWPDLGNWGVIRETASHQAQVWAEESG